MKIDFWLDPACPWCWLTSRWLVNYIQEEKNLEINWRPISLFIKNNPDEDSKYYLPTKHTLGLLRVFSKLKQSEGNQLAGEFYTAAGTAIHLDAQHDVTAKELLEKIGFDQSKVEKLSKAYDDQSIDEHIKSEMEDAFKLVGTDIGTPIIGLYSEDSNEPVVGIFGPVISKVPANTQEALKLWDCIYELSFNENFWELKRTRQAEPNFEGL